MNRYTMSDEEREFLEKYDVSKYERPSLTADIAVFSIMKEETDEYRKDPEQQLGVLLVKRNGYPYKDCWALPGGFAEIDENLYETALRELKEETSVDSAFIEPFGLFSDPGRDPRGWVVSQGYLALVDAEKCKVEAGSDAGNAQWFRIRVNKTRIGNNIRVNTAEIRTRYDLTLELKSLGEELKAVVVEKRSFRAHHETVSYEIEESGSLAFDHAKIIVMAFKALHEKASDAGRIIFDLMPERFTLYQLQEAYEIVLGEELTTPNFRRKIAPYVTETDEVVTGAGHRPAKLFKRNLEAFYALD